MHICKRCGRVFTKKSNLLYHLNNNVCTKNKHDVNMNLHTEETVIPPPTTESIVVPITPTHVPPETLPITEQISLVIKPIIGNMCPMCPMCDRTFASKQMCQYHVLHNVCKKNIKVVTHEPVTIKSILQFDNLDGDEMLTELIRMNTKLMQVSAKYDTLKENPQQQINNVNVFPSAYGTEDVLKIQQQRMGDIFGRIIKKTDISKYNTFI